MTRTLPLPAALLLLAACSGADPANDAAAGNDAVADAPAAGTEVPPTADAEIETLPASEGARPTDGWVGRWTGPEGLTLDIQPQGEDYRLAMQYTLDESGTFTGRAEGDRIVFERGGQQRTLTPATGDETGMKWLAGKRDCLVVIPQSEAYCRD